MRGADGAFAILSALVGQYVIGGWATTVTLVAGASLTWFGWPSVDALLALDAGVSIAGTLLGAALLVGVAARRGHGPAHPLLLVVLVLAALQAAATQYVGRIATTVMLSRLGAQALASWSLRASEVSLACSLLHDLGWILALTAAFVSARADARATGGGPG